MKAQPSLANGNPQRSWKRAWLERGMVLQKGLHNKNIV